MRRELVTVIMDSGFDQSDVNNITCLTDERTDVCRAFEFFTDEEHCELQALLENTCDLDSDLWGTLYTKMFGEYEGNLSTPIRTSLIPPMVYGIVGVKFNNAKQNGTQVRVYYTMTVNLPKGFKLWHSLGKAMLMTYGDLDQYNVRGDEYHTTIPQTVSGVDLNTREGYFGVTPEKVAEHIEAIKASVKEINEYLKEDLARMQEEISVKKVANNQGALKAKQTVDLINSLLK